MEDMFDPCNHNTFGDPNGLAHGTNDAMLPDDMVLNAVHTACDFFGIPEVPTINASGTCVWSNDSSTYDDDVFGFNRQELQALGVSGEDSLTLIYTHECAHRTLQGAFNDSWEEELACDFFAGVHAGMKGMNLDNFEASLGTTAGGATHPNGALRTEFIQYGKHVVEDMQARGIEITYENCLERLNDHITERSGIIAEYRSKLDPEMDLSIHDDDLSALNERASGIERPEHDEEENLTGRKGYLNCATRHGCSGATDCNYSYGDYHR